MIRFGTYSYALSLGALNGAVVAGALLRARRNRVANRLLAGLLAVVVLRLVPYILGYAGFYDTYPWLSFAPFDLPLAIGPLLWLHVVRLTGDRLPRRWWWHLVPAALHFVSYFALFAFATLEQKSAIVVGIIDPFVAPAIITAALVGLAAYGLAALRALRHYQGWLDDHLSNREEFRLAWLRRLLVIMAALGAVWLGFAAFDSLVRPLSYFDEFPFYLTQAGAAWVLGLLAWKDAEVDYPTPGSVAVLPAPVAEPTPPAEADARPSPSMDWKAMGDRYLDTLRREGWWRDPQLSLGLLARHLATNTSYLSKALNQGLGMNFNECVNRLRVEGVAAALRAGSTLDLVQIGFDAGFNSRASFQRAFTLYAGTTPSAYREAVRRGEVMSQSRESGP